MYVVDMKVDDVDHISQQQLVSYITKCLATSLYTT